MVQNISRWSLVSGWRVCDWSIQYHLCSRLRLVVAPAVVAQWQNTGSTRHCCQSLQTWSGGPDWHSTRYRGSVQLTSHFLLQDWELFGYFITKFSICKHRSLWIIKACEYETRVMLIQTSNVKIRIDSILPTYLDGDMRTLPSSLPRAASIFLSMIHGFNSRWAHQLTEVIYIAFRFPGCVRRSRKTDR